MPATRSYGVPPPEYRLPDATHLGGIKLQVSDLDRSRSFYTEVLGLQILSDDKARIALGVPGTAGSLIELSSAPGVQPIPRNGRLGLYHFAVLVPARAALGEFVVHLAGLHVPFSSADHLVSEAIYLWDPDGLGIEVYADRKRANWRVNSGELVMATDRLDLASLVDAAKQGSGQFQLSATTSHTGALDQTPFLLPRDTAMGHMHLSVGDLSLARNFYHDALGLDAIVWSYPGAVFLSAGGYHHHLGANTWSATAPTASERDARLLEWTMVLPEQGDVRRAGLSLKNAGYDVEMDGEDRLVVDPWGTVLRLSTPA